MTDNYIFKKDCVVDADNKFDALGMRFSIPKDNREYRVVKKYTDGGNYENESQMMKITVIVSGNMCIEFYDEDCKKVEGIEVIS